MTVMAMVAPTTIARVAIELVAMSLIVVAM